MTLLYPNVVSLSMAGGQSGIILPLIECSGNGLTCDLLIHFIAHLMVSQIR